MGLLDWLFPEDVRTLRQSVPTEGWCSAYGFGRMNLVWPWYVVENPQPLVDNYGRDAELVPALELRCPRTDFEPSLLVWGEPAGPDPTLLSGPNVVQPGASWAQSVASMRGGRLDDGYAVRVDGVRGYVARVSDIREVEWRIILPRPDKSVHILVTVPCEHSEAYWMQVETMLATWGWAE